MNPPADPPPAIPTRRQLDAMAARLGAGAEPGDLARWISRISGTRIPVEVLTQAATDLRDGTAERWYSAATAGEASGGA
mgnify:CR=1 FL=1